MERTVFLRLFALVCVALGMFPLANALSAGTAVPWWNDAVREWVISGSLVAALSAALAGALAGRVDDAQRRVQALLLAPRPGVFALMAFLIALLLTALLARWAFGGHPFTSDEMAQQWHARILLSGRVTAVAEPFPEFFNTAPVFDRDGRWFSQYPIGGPALIALGLLVNAPWLVNPVLIGLATLGLYAFLRQTSTEVIARFTVVLFVTSPMVLIMGASQMNHVAALAGVMVALAALARWDSSDTARALYGNAVVIGASIGVVALVRPLDAAITGTVVGSYQLWAAVHSRDRRTSLAVQTVAFAILIVVLLWANAATTGRPFLFGYEALNGAAHGLGFHVDPAGELHTPRRGLVIASGYLLRLNRYLFEWPIPAMLFVASGLVLLRPSRWDVLMASLAAAFVVAYGLYWFDGFFSGPRFLFTVVPVFVYAAACAPGGIAAVLPAPIVRRALVILVPMCLLWAWGGPAGGSSARVRVASYREQRTKLKTDIEAQLRTAGMEKALVFVNDGWRGRLLARLRVLGVSQFRAERILNAVDACALQTALDAETLSGQRADAAERVVRRARAFGKARLEPDLPADRAIALVPGSRPTDTCVREFLRDTTGTMPYPMFLARQSVDADGRVGGDVVFARDLGERNVLLRSRFAGRAWYVYRPGRYLGDTARVFRPYKRQDPE